uniref:Uncharacterized protein n=1 Tax=Anguilla anguilla TaxID=7936 RepID=A0A0E9WNZ4_ANGAN
MYILSECKCTEFYANVHVFIWPVMPFHSEGPSPLLLQTSVKTSMGVLTIRGGGQSICCYGFVKFVGMDLLNLLVWIC